MNPDPSPMNPDPNPMNPDPNPINPDLTLTTGLHAACMQAFDFSALQPSSSLLDMDNPFATKTEFT